MRAYSLAMLTYEQAIEPDMFHGLTREAYDIWAAADAMADAALAAYNVADEAVLAAVRRQVPRSEKLALMAARDAAETALDVAQAERDAVTPR